MCGIAGIFSPDYHPSRLKSACRQMLHSLEHRGPDAQGMYEDANLVLGHQRLSIIDFSENANQPIANEDSTIWLSFNGEIYNFQSLREKLCRQGHHFRSRMDGEVILHLYERYEMECLKYLRGMFAFALWDEQRKKLFIARDRFGIKPLYYGKMNSTFVFASEVNAILESGMIADTLNANADLEFLKYGSIPSPQTVYQAIDLIPAGHYLEVDCQGGRLKPYWSLDECFRRSEAGAAPHPDRLRSSLDRVTKEHLVSDAPLAILLSGGVDSSALVALAHNGNCDALATMTLRFEDEHLDESRSARVMSDRFGTVHHECLVTASDFKSQLDYFIEALDQPTVDGFNTYLVSKAAKEKGFRVLLSGLGGDEVFGGYPHFGRVTHLFKLVSVLRWLPVPVRRAVLSGFSAGAHARHFYGADRLHYLSHPSHRQAYLVYRGLFDPGLLDDLVPQEKGFISQAQGEMYPQLDSGLDLAFAMEFKGYLHNQLLRDSDVMSMRHSVEMRVPFLDHELVESVLSLPEKDRFSPNAHKMLLKGALGDLLPEEIFAQKKRGFIFPMDRWMRGSLRAEVESVLLDESSSRTPFLKREGVHKVWQQFLSGQSHWSLPWSLYVLNRWHAKRKAKPALDHVGSVD
jgi:asparagine synthase (glutamine-hydrolysing)